MDTYFLKILEFTQQWRMKEKANRTCGNYDVDSDFTNVCELKIPTRVTA